VDPTICYQSATVKLYIWPLNVVNDDKNVSHCALVSGNIYNLWQYFHRNNVNNVDVLRLLEYM